MVVCLALTGSAQYLTHDIGGRSVIDRVRGVVESLSNVERVLVVSRGRQDALPQSWEQRLVAAVTEQEICDALALLTGSADTEIVFTYLDQPFVSGELTAVMLDRHRGYRADYTFADGYPRGLAPEIISGRVVAHLQSLATAEPLTRSGLFPIVAKDINRIDVETVLSSGDHRMLRIELAADSRANVMLCERLAQREPQTLEQWESVVAQTRLEHRTLPRFVSVQVVEQEVQKLAYSPYSSMREDVLSPGRVMSAQRFSQLIEMVSSFAPEAVVHISLWGEVALHPETLSLVKSVLEHPGLSLLIETSGIGWDEQTARELFEIQDERLQLIVGLDTDDAELYAQIRGDGFREARAFAERAIEKMGRRAHVQAVRSELSEPKLDLFYKTWKAVTENVIIQKYDHFCKRLPQIRIGDLSPLHRFPCWHLQRDLHVLVDGTVPLCREDTDAAGGFGNIFSDGIESVWHSGMKRYADHVEGSFAGLCKECDEYYTFAF